ncbi:unnamed protein product [Parnassius mnemosyne]|uniref:Phosphatidic acid phosphatase type 2/haloperoxidase domain-containing protein n=1 Tax=Parnassius mnemosyne TaxID=213953 RepID=A0AAV1L2J7_9NEOP
MWRENVPTRTYNLYKEISVRAILVFVLCVLYQKFQPRKHYITEAELLNLNYRHPRKESRVTLQSVIVLIICIPLIIITSDSLLRNYVETFQGLLGWNLAILTNAVITEAIKITVCRPRPDFFYRCFSNGVLTADLICTGEESDVIDGRKSFPSGHSSFAFCSLGFISIWLYGKLRLIQSRGIVFIMCTLPLIIAAFISITRVYDNRHHWQDVVGGSLLGFFISYASYMHYHHPPPLRARNSSEFVRN